MTTRILKNARKLRRASRTRSNIKGHSHPRLSVFRSLTNIYAQVIDDNTNKTIASASSKELDQKAKQTKIEKAKAVGELVAKRALENKITKVVFDRGEYKYHGRVKALAEGAREAGLNV